MRSGCSSRIDGCYLLEYALVVNSLKVRFCRSDGWVDETRVCYPLKNALENSLAWRRIPLDETLASDCRLNKLLLVGDSLTLIS